MFEAIANVRDKLYFRFPILLSIRGMGKNKNVIENFHTMLSFRVYSSCSPEQVICSKIFETLNIKILSYDTEVVSKILYHSRESFRCFPSLYAHNYFFVQHPSFRYVPSSSTVLVLNDKDSANPVIKHDDIVTIRHDLFEKPDAKKILMKELLGLPATKIGTHVGISEYESFVGNFFEEVKRISEIPIEIEVSKKGKYFTIRCI